MTEKGRKGRGGAGTKQGQARKFKNLSKDLNLLNTSTKGEKQKDIIEKTERGGTGNQRRPIS